jgi:hypothetical protein
LSQLSVVPRGKRWNNTYIKIGHIVSPTECIALEQGKEEKEEEEEEVEKEEEEEEEEEMR